MKFTSELWDATCQWDHTVLPPEWLSRLHPNRAGWYAIYQPRKDERLSWPSWLVTYRDGLPVHRRSPIRVLTGSDVAQLCWSTPTVKKTVYVSERLIGRYWACWRFVLSLALMTDTQTQMMMMMMMMWCALLCTLWVKKTGPFYLSITLATIVRF